MGTKLEDDFDLIQTVRYSHSKSKMASDIIIRNKDVVTDLFIWTGLARMYMFLIYLTFWYFFLFCLSSTSQINIHKTASIEIKYDQST